MKTTNKNVYAYNNLPPIDFESKNILWIHFSVEIIIEYFLIKSQVKGLSKVKKDQFDCINHNNEVFNRF